MGEPVTLTWVDWQAIAVPLVLAVGAVAVLLIDAFWRSASAQLRHTVVTLLTSVVILFGLVFVWAQRDDFKPAFCRAAV
jgi:NADH-quinone oxidoreductase subunit N